MYVHSVCCDLRWVMMRWVSYLLVCERRHQSHLILVHITSKRAEDSFPRLTQSLRVRIQVVTIQQSAMMPESMSATAHWIYTCTHQDTVSYVYCVAYDGPQIIASNHHIESNPVCTSTNPGWCHPTVGYGMREYACSGS